MIDFIEGKLEEKGEEGAVISVGGLGLGLFVSTPTLQNLPAIGEKVRLYGYLHVREDLLQLYGFGDRRERELFLKLISVSGIGPKVALALLSAYDPETFVRLVSTEDLEAITAVSGVGKKSGQRIILELKGKLDDIHVEKPGEPQQISLKQEGINALVSLGYTRNLAVSTVESVFKLTKVDNLEILLRESFKVLRGD